MGRPVRRDARLGSFGDRTTVSCCRTGRPGRRSRSGTETRCLGGSVLPRPGAACADGAARCAGPRDRAWTSPWRVALHELGAEAGSSALTESGSRTSTAAPQPARCSAIDKAIGAATRTRTLPSSHLSRGSQCRPKWSRRTGSRRPSMRSVAERSERRRSTCSTTRPHSRDRWKSLGRSATRSVTVIPTIRSTRNVRWPVSVPATRYQTSPLATSPHGSTMRLVGWWARFS